VHCGTHGRGDNALPHIGPGDAETLSTAYRYCPASLAGTISLILYVLQRSEMLKDFRRGVRDGDMYDSAVA
jgi:hypothetical protein